MNKSHLSERGFVLMAALMFLQMFSLLGVLLLMTAMLQLKSTHHVWKSEKNAWLSLHIQTEIESRILQALPACIVTAMPSENIARMKKSWWKQNGCSGEKAGARYYFVIEALGTDPCSVMTDKANHQPTPVGFYRLSLYVNFTQERDAKIILQSTIARTEYTQSVCTEKLHQVSGTRQMRRQLIAKGWQDD